MSVVNHAAGIVFDYSAESVAFPTVKHGHRPFGERVLVQIRKALTKTKGGVIVPEATRQTEHDNTQVAKLLMKGSLAFCNRETGKPWPEGDWCKIGDYVRVPKYGGDRFEVRDQAGEPVVIAIFRDTDLLAGIDDPLVVRAFL